MGYGLNRKKCDSGEIKYISDGMTAHYIGLNEINVEHHAVHASKRRFRQSGMYAIRKDKVHMKYQKGVKQMIYDGNGTKAGSNE